MHIQLLITFVSTEHLWFIIFACLFSAKIPFPLTQRFRGMLQNGIDLSTVDVSYVSSRSWFVNYIFSSVNSLGDIAFTV